MTQNIITVARQDYETLLCKVDGRAFAYGYVEGIQQSIANGTIDSLAAVVVQLGVVLSYLDRPQYGGRP